MRACAYLVLMSVCLPVCVVNGGQHLARDFDDRIENRLFDNWQFVEFHQVIKDSPRFPEAAFALSALEELPAQYKMARTLHLLGHANPYMSYPVRPPALVDPPVPDPLSLSQAGTPMAGASSSRNLLGLLSSSFASSLPFANSLALAATGGPSAFLLNEPDEEKLQSAAPIANQQQQRSTLLPPSSSSLTGTRPFAPRQSITVKPPPPATPRQQQHEPPHQPPAPTLKLQPPPPKVL